MTMFNRDAEALTNLAYRLLTTGDSGVHRLGPLARFNRIVS
jgi:hypothetical protein